MKDKTGLELRHSSLMAVVLLLLVACGGAQPPATPTRPMTAVPTDAPPTATVTLATDTPAPPTETAEPPTTTAEPPTETAEPVALYKGAAPGVNEDGAPTLGSADAPVVMIDYSDFL